MSVGNVFFAVCSIIALVGAVITIGARNPIRCALGLMATIVGIAGLFLRLDAQFMAAIQLIVYAGAVVVLFVFVIMLLGPDAGPAGTGIPKARLARTVGGVSLAVLALWTGALLLSAQGKPVAWGPVPEGYGSVAAVGQLMFGKGLVPFELATALLIVAVVGAIAVAKSKHVPKAAKAVENPTQRLFHGPLHPRDAGRPLPKESA